MAKLFFFFTAFSSKSKYPFESLISIPSFSSLVNIDSTSRILSSILGNVDNISEKVTKPLVFTFLIRDSSFSSVITEISFFFFFFLGLIFLTGFFFWIFFFFKTFFFTNFFLTGFFFLTIFFFNTTFFFFVFFFIFY